MATTDYTTVPQDVMEAAGIATKVFDTSVGVHDGHWSIRTEEGSPRHVAAVVKSLSPRFPQIRQTKGVAGGLVIMLRRVTADEKTIPVVEDYDAPQASLEDDTHIYPTTKGTAMSATATAPAKEHTHAAHAHAASTPEAPPAPPPALCLCGCGVPVNKGSRFKPGHDARYHAAEARKIKEENFAKAHGRENLHYLTSRKHNVEKAEKALHADRNAATQKAADASAKKEKSAA